MAKVKPIKPSKLQPKVTPAAPLKKRVPALLFAILGLGLLVRALHLYFSKESPFFEPLLLDPGYYHKWAERILGGDWVGEGVFYGLPLYPFFLAGCYKLFQNSILAVKAVQAFLGFFTVFFIYKIGEKIHSQKAGLLAALFAVFYGPLFFHEVLFIPETLSIPLYAASFYLALGFVDGPSLKKGMLLGVLFGLSTLTKAGIILFVVIFLVTLLARALFTGQGKAPAVMLCFIAFAATLAPVAAHNKIYGNDTVLLTSHGGLNFYIGNNPTAEGVFASPQQDIGTNIEAQIEDSKAVAEKELGRSLKPSEVSRYWSEKAWNFIWQNPGQFGSLLWKKFVLFFDAREISDVEDYVFAANFNPLLKFPWLNFVVLGPLFFLGLAASFWNARHRLLTGFWVFFYIVGVVAFFINARYRLPLLPVFIPVAALGVVELFKSLKEMAWGRLFFYALFLCAGVGLSQARLVDTNWSRDYLNAGDVYLEKKDYDKAISFYKKALEAEPKLSKADQAMGIVLTKIGRYGEAKGYYLKAVLSDPHNALAYNSLGLAYDREGDLTEAKRCFLKALELKPNSSQAHNNLGMVYGKMGENGKAIQEFEIALKLNPKSARAYTNLGLIQYRLGKTSEAKDLWQRALSIDPEFEEARRALRFLNE